MQNFKCIECGYCCSHLQTCGNFENSRMAGLYGMYLSEKEAAYFPNDMKHPLFEDQFGRVFAYQIKGNSCPHLILREGKSSCAIYTNRPLGCKMFPLMENENG